MRINRMFLLTAILVLAAPLLLAQQPAMPMPPAGDMQMPMHKPGDMEGMDCQAMMQKMQTMHASMKAMDDKLAGMVDAMNKAKGSAKVDRMAAVINELVTQRNQMRDDMAAMMPQMMHHMMQHMQGAMMSGMQSMENCPMMKGGKQDVSSAPMVHK